ncbi:MAG: aspartate aminotransferase family protein [Candidatus Hadarchaeia archaeon]
MDINKVKELDQKFIVQTYNRHPIELVKGRGVKVWDSEGKEYLDFLGGIAVTALGHTHPAVTKAIREQAEKLIHVSNLYYISNQAKLAQKLAEISPKPIQKFFFCNSGTEAVEAAMKLAVKHTHGDKIVALKHSFHGRTSASLGVTWKDAYKKQFSTLISSSYDFIQRNDLEEAKKKIGKNTAAIIAEPVIGEGGIRPLSGDFLKGLRELCNDTETLLIFDEVQAGMCRTGKWFACQHWNVDPDIITLAKALGNGFPIGAMGSREKIARSFEPGDHASTFGGNPLACKTARTVIETMQLEDIPSKVREKGDYFKEKLEELTEKYGDLIEEVRGIGLMLGMEIKNKETAKKVHSKLMDEGFLTNITAEKVLRFVPPLIVKEKQIDKLIDELNKVLGKVK